MKSVMVLRSVVNGIPEGLGWVIRFLNPFVCLIFTKSHF